MNVSLHDSLASDIKTQPSPEAEVPVSQSIETLTQAMEGYQAHHLLLRRNGVENVQSQFKRLFREWKAKPSTPVSPPPIPTETTIEAQWKVFKASSNPTAKDKIRMLREGLSSDVLLHQVDFIAWLQRWDYSQRLCFKWLHTCVWQRVVLQPNVKFQPFHKNLFMLYHRILTQHNYQLQLSKVHMQAWQEVYQAHKKNGLAAWSVKQNKALLQQVLASKISINEVPAWLCESAQKQYGLLTPLPLTHPWVEHVLDLYFESALQQYKTASTTQVGDLHQLLETFCGHLQTEVPSLKRLIKLWHTLGFATGTHTAEERRCLQAFCQTKLEDPRLDPANWLPLKQLAPNIHTTLLYWFNEAGFNLFFKFAFKGAVDRHGRKEFWQQYLPLATDFKVIVSSYEKQRDFLSLSKDELGYIALQPFVNTNGTQTGEIFILRMGDALVCEFTKEGNAVYIYSKKYLDQNHPVSKPMIQLIDDPNGWKFEVVGATLKNTNVRFCKRGLSTTPTYLTSKHWYFYHNGDWQGNVKNMLEECYNLKPVTKQSV